MISFKVHMSRLTFPASHNSLATPALQQTATEHQKLAGQNQIQLSHATAMNRYPEEYSAVQNYFQTLASEGRHPSGSINQKLLSFGASTGEEAITLASMYFMNSTFTIFGVDLDEDSLDKAKASAVAHSPKFDDNKIMFFNGNTTDISVHGPYDAIFANSVLCYHGAWGDRNVNPQSILNKFPFSAFEDSLGYLDANLNVGGILAIVNTNYHFADTKLYKRYKTLAQCKNFVPKVNASSVSYEKNYHRYDCVWKKEE